MVIKNLRTLHISQLLYSQASVWICGWQSSFFLKSWHHVNADPNRHHVLYTVVWMSSEIRVHVMCLMFDWILFSCAQPLLWMKRCLDSRQFLASFIRSKNLAR